jgi:hypothetical protein
MSRTKTPAILAAAAVIASAGFAHAGLVTGNLPSDAAFNALALPEVAVAEGRIGNNALNGTHELTIGQDTGAPAQTAQLIWGNGVAQAFTLTYDAGNNALEFQVGKNTLSYALGDAINGIYIRTRATNLGTGITVDNFTLNGDPIAGASATVGNGADYFFITGNQLLSGFTLTGDATLSWETQPSQSQLAFQVKLTIPTPGTVGLLAMGGLLATRRRR